MLRSIVTEPPWSLTILLTIASPSPVPFGLLSFTNGSNAAPAYVFRHAGSLICHPNLEKLLPVCTSATTGLAVRSASQAFSIRLKKARSSLRGSNIPSSSLSACKVIARCETPVAPSPLQSPGG